MTSLAWAPSGRSSPQRRANTCCFTHFKALFLTRTSSSAAAGQHTGDPVTTAGPPDLHLATPGMASRPSASSSLDSPTIVSSSVSKGCSTFHLDTFKTEHSNTDFNKFASAKTVKDIVNCLVHHSYIVSKNCQLFSRSFSHLDVGAFQYGYSQHS